MVPYLIAHGSGAYVMGTMRAIHLSDGIYISVGIVASGVLVFRGQSICALASVSADDRDAAQESEGDDSVLCVAALFSAADDWPQYAGCAGVCADLRVMFRGRHHWPGDVQLPVEGAISECAGGMDSANGEYPDAALDPLFSDVRLLGVSGAPPL